MPELSPLEWISLIKEVEQGNIWYDIILSSLHVKLDYKLGQCPQCISFNYDKFGIAKSNRRY
jgi:hypothetical protein